MPREVGEGTPYMLAVLNFISKSFGCNGEELSTVPTLPAEPLVEQGTQAGYRHKSLKAHLITKI